MIWQLLVGVALILIGMAFLERAEKQFAVTEDEFDFVDMLGAWGWCLLGGGFFIGAGILILLYLAVHA